MARNRPNAPIPHSAETSGKPPEEDGSAPASSPAPREPLVVKPPKSYRVMNGGHVMIKGCRTGLRAGKVINEANFDIASLKLQGIVLEEIPQLVRQGSHAAHRARESPSKTSSWLHEC